MFYLEKNNSHHLPFHTCRKNAFNPATYDDIVSALVWADRVDDVVLAVLSGRGDYYSSGNDLSNFASPEAMSDPAKMARDAGVLLRRFTSAFIDFSKPLIAAVNGPALGVAVTTLALCDVVYASSTASFNTPFVRLGQSPEGVSSMLFPALMGGPKAMEVLLFGRELSAREACDRNLVTEVFEAGKFQDEVRARAIKYATSLPPSTLRRAKALVRGHQLAEMKRVMNAEVDLLVELWLSPECAEAVMKFMQEAYARRQAKKARKSRL